jgi:hypothetical protein
VSGSEAILLACPSGTIEDALNGVEGIGTTPVIDATNIFGNPGQRASTRWPSS